MDFELPEEHQLAYESALRFAQDEISPHNAEIERTDDFRPGSGNVSPNRATQESPSPKSMVAAAAIS